MSNSKQTMRLLMAVTALSVGSAAHADDWQYRLIMYGQGAALDGDVTVRGLTSSVDMDFKDVLDDLEFGFLGAFQARRGPWSVGFDFNYLGLGQSSDRPDAVVDIDNYIAELTGGYQVTDNVELLAGLRYLRMDSEIDFRGPLGVEVSGEQDWVDPLVGVRLTLPLNERWLLRGRADVGGFDVGSDFTWQLGGYVEYVASPSWSVVAGYRVLDIDYTDDDGRDRFAFDAQIAGPILGVTLDF